MHHSIRLVPLLVMVLAVAAGDSVARTKPRPCDPGRYLVTDGLVLVDAGAPLPMDVITVGDTIGILSGCPAVRSKRRVSRVGTRIKVRLRACAGIAGHATLKATIAPDCLTMTGVFRAKKAKIRKPFGATRSMCGDGIFDPAGGEACDVGQGCVAATCADDCTCSGPTTTVPTTSTTAASLPLSTSTTTASMPTTTTVTTTTAPVSSSTATTSSTASTSTATDTTTTSSSSSTTTTTSTTSTTTTSTTMPPPTLPDLRPTAFQATPVVVDAGAQIMLSWTVVNEGSAAASQPWTDSVTLSTDEVVGDDVTSTLLTHTQDLGVGGSYDVVGRAFTIPDVPAGTYFLILRVDANDNVAEGNDDDNTFPTTIPITVRAPDLRPTAFNVDDQTVSAGQVVHLSWTVKNEGTGLAQHPWSDFVNFSTDQVVGGDVTSTFVVHTHDLAVDGTYTVGNLLFTIPNVAPGTYFLILRVDANGEVYEGNDEGDDTFPTALPITVQ